MNISGLGPLTPTRKRCNAADGSQCKFAAELAKAPSSIAVAVSSDDAKAVATMAIVFPREWLARESFAQDLLGVFLAIFAVLFTVLVLMSRKRSSSTATPAATPAAAKKKVAKVDDFPNGPLVILWGSQTGTAEGFGKTLAREARQRGFKARSIDLEDYEPDELAEEEAPVVFLMATHGERPRSTLV